VKNAFANVWVTVNGLKMFVVAYRVNLEMVEETGLTKWNAMPNVTLQIHHQ
jgi:phosphatidylserine decarboxylase